MQRLKFRDLPLVAKISIALTGLIAWTRIEELVIEPYRLYVWMPFYRVGNFCVYDAVVCALILVTYLYLDRAGHSSAVNKQP